MLRLENIFINNNFIVTAEITPPKGPLLNDFLQKANYIKKYVDAINVPDNSMANMRLSSLAGCITLLREGIDPILQITCRDRNILALQSDLIGAYSLGIKNVLVMFGDSLKCGEYPSSKAVYEVNSVKLLETIDKLNKGVSFNGKELDGCCRILSGAVFNPNSSDFDQQLKRLEKKIDAGARFVQTQPIASLKNLGKLRDLTNDKGVKLIGGVILLRSYEMASYMNNNIPGIKIPETILKDLRFSKNPLQTGVKIAAGNVAEIRDFCNGIHIMAIRKEDKMVEILRESGLCK